MVEDPAMAKRSEAIHQGEIARDCHSQAWVSEPEGNAQGMAKGTETESEICLICAYILTCCIGSCTLCLDNYMRLQLE